MKVKNLLKKSTATLLCVSTLGFSVGVSTFAFGSTPISKDSQLVRIFDTQKNEWGSFKLLTDSVLKKLSQLDNPYQVCVGTPGNECKNYNFPSAPVGWFGKVCNVLSWPFGIVKTIAGLAWPIMQMFPLIALGGMFAKNFIKEYFGSYFNTTCGNIEEVVDPIEAIRRLDKYLETIKGQDEAKAELRRFVLNLIDDKNQRLKGLSKKKGANIIYLVGPSGVGKSMSAETLTKVLTGDNSKPYIVEPSDIDKESKKASVVDQLFGMRTRKVNMNEIYEKSPLVAQVQATPNMVLIINEYDKMCTKELDEKLRTIADHGYVNVNGEMVDFSKVTIIITSNEDLGSVTKTEHKDDGTGSRTQVEHDKAFLNRLKIVDFKNLSAKDYVEIEKPLFELLQQRYLSDYNVLVTFEDGLLEKVAKLVEQKNQGARPIQTFIDNINDKLLTDVILKGSNDKSYIGKTVNISLKEDGNNSNFILNETIDYNKVLEILITKLKNVYSTNYNMNLEISDEAKNDLVKFLKENNGTAETAANIINSLNKKISDSIISKDKKKKSYMGKSYKVSLKNMNWEINEFDPSKETESVNADSNQESETKETSPSSSESETEKQKTEIKALEGTAPHVSIEKSTVETTGSAAAA